MISILLIAVALSLDAFAVSVASGICVSNLKFRHALRSSFSFGAFQFAMPLAGWLLGGTFRAYIQGFDHWIGFGLLALVGGKMIKESFKTKNPASCSDEEKANAADPVLNLIEWEVRRKTLIGKREVRKGTPVYRRATDT